MQVDMLQILASFEHIVSDFGYLLWQCEFSDAAVTEYAIAHRCDCLWEGYFPQIRTISKQVVAYGGYGIRNDKLGETAATLLPSDSRSVRSNLCLSS